MKLINFLLLIFLCTNINAEGFETEAEALQGVENIQTIFERVFNILRNESQDKLGTASPEELKENLSQTFYTIRAVEIFFPNDKEIVSLCNRSRALLSVLNTRSSLRQQFQEEPETKQHLLFKHESASARCGTSK